MPVGVKICGINSPAAMAAVVAGGAQMVGFNFYPPSPRAITAEEAGILAAQRRGDTAIVGVFVNESDASIAEVLRSAPLDLLQLHGGESLERVAEIRRRFNLPVIKVLPIATREDLDQVDRFVEVADHLLFDAKPPKGMKNALPGGNALHFDWTLLADCEALQGEKPPSWLLSGGLNLDNLETAVRTSGAKMVDLASGVELRPGVKSPEKISALLAAAAAL